MGSQKPVDAFIPPRRQPASCMLGNGVASSPELIVTKSPALNPDSRYVELINTNRRRHSWEEKKKIFVITGGGRRSPSEAASVRRDPLLSIWV
ncbi:hypothetical protein EYF80_044089 [Liparis tanakae]|uniref:Uncharacterized protein n=1 Tax=Liparis tanakae TaxID=230148 RepID=A0A4Z2FWN7_9TELE|nr:hypothetical protein EYF80_044089 [Liparis tanakae]